MMPLFECIRKGRNNRIGVCVGLNALGPTARTVLADANYHIVGRTKDHKGLGEAANTLVLPHGAEAILPGLAPGEFLFRGPTWPDATLVNIYPNLLPPVPDTIPYHTLPFIPSRKLHEMPHVLQALQDEKKTREAANLCIVRTKKTGLTDKSKKSLSLACEMVGFPASSIFNVMGKIPYEIRLAIQRELEAFKLINFELWRIEKSSRLFQEVNPSGFELVGKTPVILKGKGSICHRCGMLWVKHAGLYYGYENAVIEFLIPGTTHAVDVAWFNSKFEDLRVFEVVYKCRDNLPQHIRTTFESGVQIKNFTIITAQKGISQEIEDRIKSDLTLFNYLNRISFEIITPYMETFLKRKLNISEK